MFRHNVREFFIPKSLFITVFNKQHIFVKKTRKSILIEFFEQLIGTNFVGKKTENTSKKTANFTFN